MSNQYLEKIAMLGALKQVTKALPKLGTKSTKPSMNSFHQKHFGEGSSFTQKHFTNSSADAAAMSKQASNQYLEKIASWDETQIQEKVAMFGGLAGKAKNVMHNVAQRTKETWGKLTPGQQTAAKIGGAALGGAAVGHAIGSSNNGGNR